jgi:molybdate transport system ATP-binding protein
MLSVRIKKQRGDFRLDVAFEAPVPGLIALFGRSGCGKSTIVNIIAGLLAPDEGFVRLDETMLSEIPAERRRIGYVFQDSRLFPHFNVMANLRYGEKRARVSDPAIRFEEVVDLLGLRALLQRRPHELSGGERQRVAVGRALLSQPRLLLLDEPLASLDLARREELLPYLESLRDRLRIPMVYVSHQFDEVLRLATHVVLLEKGAVVAAGDLSAVSLRPELRAVVGPDSIGAVIDGEVQTIDPAGGLATIRLGANDISVAINGARTEWAPDASSGTAQSRPSSLVAAQRVRVQLLARDLIIAIEQPRGLSVRNILRGTITSLSGDVEHTHLVEVDIGGPRIVSRVTQAASRELGLRVGRSVWVLVKTVSLRGHVFPLSHSLSQSTAPEDGAKLK